MLGMPAVYVEAHLEAMWKVGYENGNPHLGDQSDVELAAEWEESGRSSGEWFKAVLACRFIDEVEGGRYQIHDLHANAPDYVAARWHREMERRKDKKCENCEGVYHSPDPRSRYCSPSCRTIAWRHRKSPCVDGVLTDVDVTLTDVLTDVTDVDGPPAPAPIIPSLAAEAAEGTEEAKTAKPKNPRTRRRDDLWDAVVEVTGSDSKASARYIGRVCRSLREADPPYTPTEVRALPAICRAKGFSLPLSLGTVEKYIGWTRTEVVSQSQGKGESDAQRRARLAQERAERLAAKEAARLDPPKGDSIFGNRRKLPTQEPPSSAPAGDNAATLRGGDECKAPF